jgi:hypothetical protein
MKPSKRYKEFLIDILTKAMQTAMTSFVIAQMLGREKNMPLIVVGSICCILFFGWAASIAWSMED